MEIIKIGRIKAKETYAVRHTILRPNQTIAQCQYPGDLDDSTAHFGAFQGLHLVGILSIYDANNNHFNDSHCWQLRAMATVESIRGQGCGLKLLRAAEEYTLKLGTGCIWANARINAVGFYQKAGYVITGEEFNVPDIGPHLLVYRRPTISPSPKNHE